MNEETKSVSLVHAELPDFVNDAGKNLTNEPTKAIGQTISDLWQLVLGGRVAFAAEKQKLRYAHDLEKYRKELDAKVSAIPEGKQTEPPLQIAAQALEDSKYCVETEELRSIFTNLLARSMHIDYSDKLHPSFSKIAQQLSPLDARMLSFMKYWQTAGGLAVIDCHKKNDHEGFFVLLEGIPVLLPPNFTHQIAARSISSLQRLGLVSIPEDTHFVADDRYEAFYQSALYKELETTAKTLGHTISVKKRVAKLTVLGEDFVKICLD